MQGDKPVKLVLEATDSTWSFLLVSISLEHVCEGASDATSYMATLGRHLGTLFIVFVQLR